MSFNSEQIKKYLDKTQFIVLGTVWDGKPELRTMSSFAMEEFTTVFSTHKATLKVCQILANPQVSILFQHENQKLRSFVNITISGIAKKVEDSSGQQRIISLIGERNPRYLHRMQRGTLEGQVFFKVEPIEMKILDFGISPSPDGVKRLSFNGKEAETTRAA